MLLSSSSSSPQIPPRILVDIDDELQLEVDISKPIYWKEEVHHFKHPLDPKQFQKLTELTQKIFFSQQASQKMKLQEGDVLHLQANANLSNPKITHVRKVAEETITHTHEIEFKEKESLEPLIEKVDEAMQESDNIEKPLDEYLDINRRIPKDAREEARRRKPLLCTYYTNGTQKAGPPENNNIYGVERVDKIRTVAKAKSIAKETIRYYQRLLDKLDGEVKETKARSAEQKERKADYAAQTELTRRTAADQKDRKASAEEKELKEGDIKRRAAADQKESKEAESKRKALREKYETEIEYNRNMLHNCEQYEAFDDKGWLDCNYYRFSIRDCESYVAAARSYVAAPVNMRFHSITGAGIDQNVGVTRLGVMADMRNTWFSLEFLQDIERLQNTGNGYQIQKLLNAKIHMIVDVGRSYIKQELSDSLTFLKHLPDNSLDFLTHLEDIIKLVKDKFDASTSLKDKYRFESMLYVLNQIHQIQEEGVDRVIADRRRVLQSKMLQLVATQVKNHPHLTTEQVFKMVHVGLVNGASANPKKDKFDVTGWMHNEAVEMEDMAAMFAEFHGRQITFGRTDGPTFIDEHGNIHLPAPSTDLVDQTRRLETLYVNITPQNDTSNVDKVYRPNKLMRAMGYTQFTDPNIQRKLNDRAMLKLIAGLPEGPKQTAAIARFAKSSGLNEHVISHQVQQLAKAGKGIQIDEQFFDQIEKLMNFTTGGYQRAEDVVVAFVRSKEFACSTGCASAKDRTGVVAARFVMRFLEIFNPTLQPQNGILRNPFAPKILNPDSKNRLAIAIVYENTGEKALKVDPRLPGLRSLVGWKVIGIYVNLSFFALLKSLILLSIFKVRHQEMVAYEKREKERLAARLEAERNNQVLPVAPFWATRRVVVAH